MSFCVAPLASVCEWIQIGWVVHCTVGVVHCTVEVVHCTVGGVHCTVGVAHCTVGVVHCTVGVVHCTVGVVQSGLYTVHSRGYTVIQKAGRRALTLSLGSTSMMIAACCHSFLLLSPSRKTVLRVAPSAPTTVTVSEPVVDPNMW